ncbi:MAG: hypothetical protein E7616_04420 [Ruminococcaceae bacterium]|nr:hypothetical protein [Oscillospiraceae bacterium]
MVVAKIVGYTPVARRTNKNTGETYDAMTVYFVYSDTSAVGQIAGRCWTKVDTSSSDPNTNYSLWVKEGVMVMCEPDYSGSAKSLMPIDILADMLTKS